MEFWLIIRVALEAVLQILAWFWTNRIPKPGLGKNSTGIN
jgi:hypothetical protein